MAAAAASDVVFGAVSLSQVRPVTLFD